MKRWINLSIAALPIATAMLLGAGAAQAASSVVGQWRFDEASGQLAVDDGPFGLDGRLGDADGDDAADPTRIAGVSGGALHFDGRTYVRLPRSARLEPQTLTLEAVVRAYGSPGPFAYVMSYGAQDCTASSYALYTGADGGIAFYIFDGSWYRISASAAPADVWDGRWHHVAGVFDGRALRLFVDGRQVGEPEPAAAGIAYALKLRGSFVGTYEGTCARPLAGDVDLVRLWDGPLAPDFVAGLADAALSPSPSSLPVAPPGASNATGPGSRPPLPAIAPGTSVPVTTASPRSCRVRSSARRVRAGRLTVVTVGVAVRGRLLRHVRVRATTGARHRTLARARTGADGRARLRLRPRNRAAVRVSVTGRPDCAPVRLTVLRARRG
jgi:hypothetical protein